MRKKQELRGSSLLLLASLIWGLSYIAQSKCSESMGAFTFNGVRSFLAGFFLIAVIYVFRYRKKKVPQRGIKNFKINLIAGVLCGIVITAACVFQQWGIERTTVGKAGFITALYIIFVPMAGVFLKKKVSGIVWIGAFMATIGMYLLCVTEDFSVNMGDILVFICSLFFTIHILIIDSFAENIDGIVVSCIQFFVCGIICNTIAFFLEKPNLNQILESGIAILYSGILSCGVGYTLQIVGQKEVNPTIAALILSLESAVAAVTGYWAYKLGFLKMDQTLSEKQIIGCIIVFAAVILVQLPIAKILPKKNKKIRNGENDR